MNRTVPLLLTAPLVAGLAACTPADLVAPPAAAGAELTDFGSCEELLDYFQEHALEKVGPWGLGSGYGHAVDARTDVAMDEAAAAADSSASGAPAPASQVGTDFSGTNNQEEGVEEPDIVQTDGEIIVVVRDGSLVVVDAASAEVVGRVRLPMRGEGTSELLLDRDAGRALVLTTEWSGGGWSPVAREDGLSAYPAYGVERTVVTTVDVSDPAAPTVTGSVRLEGSYRSARMHDGTARVVMVTQPPGLTFVQPRDGSLRAEDEAEEANRGIIEGTTIDDWLPHLQTLDGGRSSGTELAVACDDVARPPEFAGLATMSVLTFDVDGDAPRPTSASGLVANGSTVYASTDRLVVATSPWEAWPMPMPVDVASGTASGAGGRDTVSTALHTFDLTRDGRTSYVASGWVEGRLLNQFALDEQDGIIRVATTKDMSTEPSSSSLVVLAEEGRALVEQGRVDDLGITERIYAVRYLSPDLAAVVTFRQTDPLYLVDTSDPSAPTVAGELKIPGYSSYLHPIGDGRLLGVGQDATEDGRTTGLQVSLFDVSDPSAPARLSQVSLKDTWSEAEHDHRAFLWWAPTGQVVLPANSWSKNSDWIGALGLQVDGQEVLEGPRLQTGGTDRAVWESPRRTLVIGDQLWVLGETTLRVADLSTFDEQARIDL